MGRPLTGRVYLRGTTWWLRYTVNGRRQAESLDTADETEAHRKAERILAPLRARSTEERVEAVVDRLTLARVARQRADREAPLRRDALPLAEVWERFPYVETSPRRSKTRRLLTSRTVEENRGAWERLVRWAAAEGLTAVDQVGPAQGEAWSRSMVAEGLTGGRHNKLLALAGAMFRAAGRADPFAAVRRYEVRHESRRHLEPAEAGRLVAEASGELRVLILIGLYTGLRLGDAATLEWGRHVDLAFGRVQKVTAKTRHEVTFPLHAVLAEELGRLKGKRTGYVLPGIAGEYLERRVGLSHRLRRVFEAAGLQPVEGSHARLDRHGKRVRVEPAAGRTKGIVRYGFHSLRHTFVTLCARGGVPQGVVREWVGHASAEVTRIYEHWGETEKARVLTALPDVRGKG